MLTKCYDKPICENSSVASSRTIRRAHVSGFATFLGFNKRTCTQYFHDILRGRARRESLTKDESLARKGSVSGTGCFGLEGMSHAQALWDTVASVKNGFRVMLPSCPPLSPMNVLFLFQLEITYFTKHT